MHSGISEVESLQKKSPKKISDQDLLYNEKLRYWERALFEVFFEIFLIPKADIENITGMVTEIELNRIKFFNQSIQEVCEALKSAPDSFEIIYKLSFYAGINLTSVFFPSDTVAICKKGNKIMLKFSLIKIEGLTTKKKPTSVVVDFNKGQESVYLIRYFSPVKILGIIKNQSQDSQPCLTTRPKSQWGMN